MISFEREITNTNDTDNMMKSMYCIQIKYQMKQNLMITMKLFTNQLCEFLLVV